MKKIAIGKSDFKSLIEDDCYYIDKTFYIKEFFEASGDVILMPRPRRFGKTLFLSTLNYFFNQEEKDESIFKDTYIYNTEFFKEHFGKYPVIHITFKDIRSSNYDDMIYNIKSEIYSLITKYKNIDLNKIKGFDEEKEIFLNIINKKANITDYEKSIRAISRLLKEYYKKKVIILIDEYDTPIITAFTKNYYDEAIEFFRNLFGSGFKDNDRYVKKVLITGIMRVSSEGLFSGLNNLNYLTILDEDMSKSCGFTLDETKKMLRDYKFNEEEIEDAIRWYNGYIFGKNNLIFNPWSIINFVNKREFESYWANTSSNDFIRVLIEKSDDFKKDLDKLLQNKPIDIEIDKNITLQDTTLYQKDTLFSFLFFAGYLKCKEKYIKKNGYEKYLRCKMVPTNVECKMIFRKIISQYVTNNFRSDYNLNTILKALTSGNLELFEEYFSYLLKDTISYFDIKTENSYHMFLLGILTNLNYQYEIISNSEAGYGRVDIILLPRDRNKLAIIMELKKINKFKEETKDIALDKAVNQIKEKDYISLAKKRGYNNIIAFGLVFDGKRCWVKEVD